MNKPNQGCDKIYTVKTLTQLRNKKRMKTLENRKAMITDQKINIMKKLFYQKQSTNSAAILIKIPMSIFTKLEKKLKFSSTKILYYRSDSEQKDQCWSYPLKKSQNVPE